MLHEGQGLPSWRKLWEEECKSVSSPGGLSRIPARRRLPLELGGAGAQGGVVPPGLCSRLQGTGGLRTSASLNPVSHDRWNHSEDCVLASQSEKSLRAMDFCAWGAPGRAASPSTCVGVQLLQPQVWLLCSAQFSHSVVSDSL